MTSALKKLYARGRQHVRRLDTRARLLRYIENASLKELRYCANVIRYNKKYASKVARHTKSR